MSDDTSALGANAAAFTIPDYPTKGETLTLRMPTWGGVIAEFKNWMIQRDRKVKVDSWEDLWKRGILTADQVAEKTEKFDDDAINGGTYSFGGPKGLLGVFQKITAVKEGDQSGNGFSAFSDELIKLVTLVLGVDDPLPLLMTRKDETLSAFKLMIMRALPPKGEGAEASKAAA